MNPYGKCEHCEKHAAVVAVSLTRGSSELVLHLCSGCNKKFEQARTQWKAVAERSQGFVTPLEIGG